MVAPARFLRIALSVAALVFAPVFGLAAFFGKLATEDALALPGWLSTHPDLAARAAANPGRAAGDDGLDAGQWAAVKAVCGRESGSESDDG